MTALRAEFPFKAYGIWVHRDVLGGSHATEVSGMRVQLTLPSDRDDFRTWELLPGDWYSAISSPTSGTVDDPDQFVSIYVFQVSVDFDADVDEASVRLGGDAPDAAVKVFDGAYEVAAKVAREFLTWVRCGRQSWIGLSTDVPELAGPPSMFDMAVGKRVPVGVTQRIGGMLRSEASALSVASLNDLWNKVSAGEDPPLAETLLADAEHLAWAGGEPADPLRAVLMAAIACEVKVKAVLRYDIDPTREPLLDFILGNPREITLTAVDGLFNKLMLATHGRSLRTDDKQLFKKVVRLFEVRNALAHRGERPGAEEFGDLVRAARQAFNWLDTIHQSKSHPST